MFRTAADGHAPSVERPVLIGVILRLRFASYQDKTIKTRLWVYYTLVPTAPARGYTYDMALFNADIALHACENLVLARIGQSSKTGMK